MALCAAREKGRIAMIEKDKSVCKANPMDEACDVVQYAQALADEQAAEDMGKMTVGRQAGLTKASVEGVLAEK